MAMNVRPFVETDGFNMAVFNNMIAQINSGVNNELEPYRAYWWRRRINVQEAIPAGYSLLAKSNVTGTPTTVSSSVASSRTVSATISYGTNVSVSDDGTVSINNAQTVTVTATSGKTTSNKVVTEYWEATGLFFSVSEIGDTIYYGTDGCTFSITSDTFDSSGCTIIINGVQKVVGYPATTGSSVGEWEYIYSTNRSAYPDSGIVDNYEYQYLGVPFDNAITASKIATGSYTGTGTYGSSNPNSLTFDFEPKYLFIAAAYDTSGNKSGLFSSSTFVDCISCEILTTSYVKGKGFSPDSSHPCFAKKSSDGKTISWYSDYAYNRQYNETNYTYYYMAIG